MGQTYHQRQNHNFTLDCSPTHPEDRDCTNDDLLTGNGSNPTPSSGHQDVAAMVLAVAPTTLPCWSFYSQPSL
jgi:hypothetical protein